MLKDEEEEGVLAFSLTYIIVVITQQKGHAGRGVKMLQHMLGTSLLATGNREHIVDAQVDLPVQAFSL